MTNNLFGKNLKQLRLENHLTQKELSNILKVASQTISFWEQGAREPDLDMLKKIAQFFQITIDELLD